MSETVSHSCVVCYSYIGMHVDYSTHEQSRAHQILGHSPVNLVSCYSPILTVRGGMHQQFDANLKQ